MEPSVVIALIALGGTVVTGGFSLIQNRQAAKLKKEEHMYNAPCDYNSKRLEALESKLDTLIEQGESIKADVARVKSASLDSLREEIRRLYYQRLDDKALYEYERESLHKLFNDYSAAGGNTYVSKIYEEMMDWDVVPPDSWRRLGGKN